MELRQRKKDVQQKGEKKQPASPVKNDAGFGFCKKFLIFDLVILAILALGYCFSPIKALEFTGWVDVPLTGPFALNNKLQNFVTIPNLPAPESMEVDKQGNLYTGLMDGRVVKIGSSPEVGKGLIQTLFNGVLEGADTTDGSDHGRPLGMRVRRETLFVVDTVYGFYKIDLKSKKLTMLLRPRDVSPPMKFPNDVSITADGKIAYITDSSSKYPMKSVADVGLMDGTCTGRVFRYNFGSKRVETVARDLCFSNGLQLSSDEKTVIVSETMRVRVSWIDVTSGRTVKNISMPMLPDNIRPTGRGTYWVAGANVVSIFGKALNKLPALRQSFACLVPPQLLRMGMPYMFDVQHSIIVEIGQDGQVVRSLHDTDGSTITGASQVTELNDGRLVIGSYIGDHASIVTL